MNHQRCLAGKEANMSNSYLQPDMYEKLPLELQGLTEGLMDHQRDLVLLSTLAVVSACLPKYVTQYFGDEIHPNLYFMAVAPAASDKRFIKYSEEIAGAIHHSIFEWSKTAYDACITENPSSNDCPPIQRFLVGGNATGASLYQLLSDSEFGVIIHETEADSLTQAISKEFGGFSDVLRKGFQHERISKSTKHDKEFISVKNPKISLILSGTFDQISPLIKSVENGLFSRFMFYTYEVEGGWGSPFEDQVGYSNRFKQFTDEVIVPLFNELSQREKSLQFILSEGQKELFNEKMSLVFNVVKEYYPKELEASVKRHGIIAVRLAMILSLIRNPEAASQEIMECHNDDLSSALDIVLEVLRHSFELMKYIDQKFVPLNEKKLLDSFKTAFTTAQLQDKAVKLGLDVSDRTLANYVKRWMTKGLVTKVKHGVYHKL